MTLDELTVKITVAADEAQKALDRLIEREKTLKSGFGMQHRLNLDGGGAAGTLKEIVRLAGNAGKSLQQMDFGGRFDWLREEFEGLRPDFSRWLRVRFDAMVDGLSREGVQMSGEMQEILWNILNNAFSLGEFESFGDLEKTVEVTLARIAETLKDPEIPRAMETLMKYWDSFGNGDSLTDGQRGEMSAAWKKVFDDDGKLVETLSDIPGITELTAQSLLALGLNADNASGMLADMGTELEGSAEAAGTAAEAFQGTEQEADNLTQTLQEQKKNLRDILSQMASLGNQDGAAKGMKEFASRLRESGKEGGDFSRSLKEMQQGMNRADTEIKTVENSLGSMNSKAASAGAGLGTSVTEMVSRLQTLIGWAKQAQNSILLKGSATVNTSSAVSSLQRLIGVAREALALLQGLGAGLAGSVAAAVQRVSSSGGGGGGGGGGGSSQDKNAEAIEDYYRLIEHKKKLNQLSLEEELKMLNTLKSRYKLDAEQQMEWEEKVFAVKEAIRQRDAERIDRLAEGIEEALLRRYQAMEEAEKERLGESRKAWENWRDESVAAIESQIDALDRLAESEEREKKDAEELRRIEKLRQEMEYEQDAFNREMIRLQLEETIRQREERRKKEALEDEKRRLEEQIGLIEKKADEQLNALDEEERRIEAYYNERTKAANLQAEAEKMILTAKQKQLFELLTEYVPEYESLGQNMGEKLASGFMKKAGDITAWFESFNSSIQKAQQQMSSASVKAAQSFYENREEAMQSAPGDIVVNQNVNFNQPVESPASVARRMEDVNDALGQMLG